MNSILLSCSLIYFDDSGTFLEDLIFCHLHKFKEDQIVTLVILQQHPFLFLSFTAPPSVSEISQPSIIYAQVPFNLKCTIQGALQRELEVKWFQLRGNTDSPALLDSVPLMLKEDLSEQASLQSDGRHHTSVLTVCLTVADDPTDYLCVVQCRGKSFRRETAVRVKGEQLWIQEHHIHVDVWWCVWVGYLTPAGQSDNYRYSWIQCSQT